VRAQGGCKAKTRGRTARWPRHVHRQAIWNGARNTGRHAGGGAMAKAAGEREGRPDRREPDAELTRRGDVVSRYVLHLRDRDDPATVLRVLEELEIPLAYLLLLPAGVGRLAAYVGVGAHDVADLPIRFASQGLHLERGEELLEGPARRCAAASTDAPPRPKRPPPRAGSNPAATRTRRRPK
jgi:hypothetical protein